MMYSKYMYMHMNMYLRMIISCNIESNNMNLVIETIISLPWLYILKVSCYCIQPLDYLKAQQGHLYSLLLLNSINHPIAWLVLGWTVSESSNQMPNITHILIQTHRRVQEEDRYICLLSKASRADNLISLSSKPTILVVQRIVIQVTSSGSDLDSC